MTVEDVQRLKAEAEGATADGRGGKPAELRYRLIYFIENQIVGVWSDVITVITTA